MEPREFRLHKGARRSLTVVGVLLFILVVTAPLAVWIWFRASRGKLTLTELGLASSALGSVRFDFTDVDRLGVLEFRVVAGGLGGALARMKVGGDYGTNVAVVLRDGKKKNVTVSMYDDHAAIMTAISKAMNKPYEELTMGLWGAKWPERVA